MSPIDFFQFAAGLSAKERDEIIARKEQQHVETQEATMGRWSAVSRDDYDDELNGGDRPERCATPSCIGLVADLDGEPFCSSCLFKREQFRKGTAKAALPMQKDEVA